MKMEHARRLLSQLMGWDSERARREFAWLDLMARVKYDGYRGYVAGARFVESLLDWLQQFEPYEREVAYSFVRERLVYIGPSELQHLVELFYPETVRRLLARSVAAESAVPEYLIWSRREVRAAYQRLLCQSLFMGISDGARMDAFRRANVGLIRNEQIVPTVEPDDRRWASLVKDLRAETGDPSAMFRFVFLVDDFVGSGLTLLRPDADDARGWSGKLIRFWDTNKQNVGRYIAPSFTLVVHHYVASARAASELHLRAQQVETALADDDFPKVNFRFGTVLPATLPVSAENAPALLELINHHYNPSVVTKSLRIGGEDVRLGFASGALPLVLEHNTPNNAIALLWAESATTIDAPEMRPLFRRRQRHQ